MVPGVRHPKVPTYRRLARETGAYTVALDGYQPYRARHEPPDRTTTEQRARIVYERVLAVEAERTAAITVFLERQGLALGPEPEAWDAIGAWVSQRIEGSREPGSCRYSPYIRDDVGGPAPTQIRGESTTQLRPIWHSIALDLSLALGREVIRRFPDARWTAPADWPGREASVNGDPLIAHGGGWTYMEAPFARVRGLMQYALLVRLGLVEAQRVRLGDALREPAGLPFEERKEPEAFIMHLRECVADNGELPDDGEVGWMLYEHGLETMPDLPPDLTALFEARRGREMIRRDGVFTGRLAPSHRIRADRLP